ETLQAYHLWKSRSNEAAASMLPEIREMLKNLWIVLPQQLDTLDVAFLLDALKELPDQDIHLIGSQGISTLMLAMQMELHKRQHHLLNSNAKALQVFLDMAAKSHSPAVWELGMDHRAWWDHYLKPWLYGQN